MSSAFLPTPPRIPYRVSFTSPTCALCCLPRARDGAAPSNRTSPDARSPSVRISKGANPAVELPTALGGGIDNSDDRSGRGSGGGGGGGGGRGRDEEQRGGDGGDSSQFWRWLLWLLQSPSFLLRSYMRVLEALPLTTKCATSGVLGAASDLIAQGIERSRGKASRAGVDWRRVGALAVVGAVLTAPTFHFLYDALEAAMPTGVGGRVGARNVCAQLVVDQVVAAPVWLVGFFALFGLVESGRFDGHALGAQLRRDYWKSLKMTWYVFPIVQVMSFSMLPSSMRVLVLNVVDLGYTSLLSMIKHD